MTGYALRQCSNPGFHVPHVSAAPQASMHECEEGRETRWICLASGQLDRFARQADTLADVAAEIERLYPNLVQILESVIGRSLPNLRPVVNDLDVDPPEQDIDHDGSAADDAARRYFG